jgi:glycogen(starch) synthase
MCSVPSKIAQPNKVKKRVSTPTLDIGRGSVAIAFLPASDRDLNHNSRSSKALNILVGCWVSSPSIGGLETTLALLLDEFAAAGCDIRLVTHTPAVNDHHERSWPYTIYRRPNVRQFIQLLMWADLYFQHHISLRMAWPLLLVRKPWVVALHTDVADGLAPDRFRKALKLRVLRSATCVTGSEASHRGIGIPAVVIGNPYDDKIFRRLPDAQREHGLVFLGRLVSDKGVDIALKVLAVLKQRGLTPGLSIIGGGPERQSLESLANQLGVERQLRFLEALPTKDVVTALNQHQIMLVPSRKSEAFGVVALEGIACGCVVVGSASGGLPEAIGPCGVLFPSEDVSAAADAIETFLREPRHLEPYRACAESHLRRHTSEIVAARYLELMLEVLTRKSR